MNLVIYNKKVNFGIKVGRNLLVNDGYETIKKIAIISEKLGFHSIWHYDHLMRDTSYQYECWTVLSALAIETKKIRLGTMVLSISYRYPSVLAKMAATLDVISNGRLELGLGAGWDEREYIAYGIPFYKPATRIKQLKEGIQIIKKMWTEDKATFKGKYYAIKDAINLPKPIQNPRPRIWIGGGGEKLLLRVVASEADGYNYAFGSPEETKHKYEVLNNHCLKIGRNSSDIEKSWQGHCIIAEKESEVNRKIKKFKPKKMSIKDFVRPRIVGTPDKCIEKIKRYIDVGVTYFILTFPEISKNTFEPIQLFQKHVIPTLKR